MNGGERESEEERMSKKKRRSGKKQESDFRQLFIIILGFASAAFGFLLLVTPANYPIGTVPITFNPLIGIVLIGIGLYLLLRRD